MRPTSKKNLSPLGPWPSLPCQNFTREQQSANLPCPGAYADDHWRRNLWSPQTYQQRAEAKKKEAGSKKKEAEASKKEVELKKKQEAELKKQKQAESKNKKVTPPRSGVTRCKVQKSGEDSVFADVTDAVVAEENEFAPESDVERSEVVRSAVIKEYREKSVRLSPKGFSMTTVSSPGIFPYVGESGTTCMRENVTPSSVIYDPLAPVDLVLFEKLMQHIKGIPPKPPAPADKPAVLSADHESLRMKMAAYILDEGGYTVLRSLLAN
ncbi:hypothetical protein F2Q68_00021331 [Brassica cretica]|uniref:Uncharacterized protein n=1 Tax=Brassica cretica TaxID=69181 RepID=A0A8S9FWR5_BRACR|nr:hypothetical protein F2Q68_00021331 [Brassica cretica]